MNSRFVIAGTDTDVGKTLFSAALMLGLEDAGAKPYYWKPVQSGFADGVDTKRVQAVSGLSSERFLPEKYIFSEAISPHRAAEIDEVKIDISDFWNIHNIPETDGTLLIEGAGGLMVPITRKNLQINVYKKWKIPLILCARTDLGTINHTLLSLEAIWSRRIPIKGIAFIGESNPDNIYTISKFSNVKILGRLPPIEDVTPENLKSAFFENFDIRDFVSDSSDAGYFIQNDNKQGNSSEETTEEDRDVEPQEEEIGIEESHG